MVGRLVGKVAVVTGAASRGEGVGNGMATAIAFAREGAKVVLVNRKAARAQKLATDIAKEGGEAAVFAGDVTKTDAAEAMAAFAVKRYSRLDILHNNVGIGGPGNPETVEMDTWNRVLRRTSLVHCYAPNTASRRCARAAADRSSTSPRSPGCLVSRAAAVPSHMPPPKPAFMA